MIFDFHNDYLIKNASLTQYTEKWGKRNIVFAIFTTHISDPFKVLEKNYTTENFFAFEDLHFINESNMYELSKFPLLYCSLTWNFENALAGGALCDGRLTDLGIKTVEFLKQNKILLDTAHLNRQSFYDVIDRTPFVINSHACLDSFHAHKRNLTKRQVELIIEKGGIIGLTPVADFLGKASIERYARCIDEFVGKFGADNLAIGTDFFGTEPLKGLRDYEDFNNLYYILSNYGYKSDTIIKIFRSNAINFINKFYGDKLNE